MGAGRGAGVVVAYCELVPAVAVEFWSAGAWWEDRAGGGGIHRDGEEEGRPEGSPSRGSAWTARSPVGKVPVDGTVEKERGGEVVDQVRRPDGFVVCVLVPFPRMVWRKKKKTR